VIDTVVGFLLRLVGARASGELKIMLKAGEVPTVSFTQSWDEAHAPPDLAQRMRASGAYGKLTLSMQGGDVTRRELVQTWRPDELPDALDFLGGDLTIKERVG
jgi:hypothetical protein